VRQSGPERSLSPASLPRQLLPALGSEFAHAIRQRLRSGAADDGTPAGKFGVMGRKEVLSAAIRNRTNADFSSS
jgi:hypothetical protein